jgi:ketosteroid isomerase-like protein
MPEPVSSNENRIKGLLEAWAAAVRRHDMAAILAYHEPDMVMYDLPTPLECKGIEAYEETWGLMFRYHKPGAAFDIEELHVTAGEDVAFAHAIMRCGPDSSCNPKDKDDGCRAESGCGAAKHSPPRGVAAGDASTADR